MDPSPERHNAHGLERDPVLGAADGRPGWYVYVWSLLGGLVLGFFGAFMQAATWTIGPLTLPVWAVVALLAMVVTARALTVTFGTRKVAVGWFAGWLMATVLLAVPWPGGDIVISDGLLQVIYVFGGVILGAAFVSLPARMASASPEGA